jgi:hypothetical protein
MFFRLPRPIRQFPFDRLLRDRGHRALAAMPTTRDRKKLGRLIATGSLQAENRINWTTRPGRNLIQLSVHCLRPAAF